MNHSKSILIIDDDKQTAKTYKDLFSQNGYDVLAVASAQDGYKKIINKRPDLVLVAHKLPDMKAHDLCLLIRGNLLTQSTSIVLIHPPELSVADKTRLLEAGFDEVVTRETEGAEILARINAILRRPQPTDIPPEPKSRPENQPVSTNDMLIERNISLNYLKRIREVLHAPRTVFKNLNEQGDFFIGLLTLFFTCFLASLPSVFERGGNFDQWIGTFSLSLMTQSMAWLALGGLIHMSMPFVGINISFRNALMIVGLSWAPRLVGAALSVIYTFIALFGFIVENSEFTAGINLIPGMPLSSWTNSLSRVGLFDVWASGILLSGVWSLNQHFQKKKWNFITLLIGLVSLAIGALSTY